MDLLESTDRWMPAAGCSKRKQSHVILEDCEEVVAVDHHPLQQQQPQQQQQQDLHIGSSLDSLLTFSRQTSGVFLRDPDVCLMNWPDQPQEQQHPALQELYSTFEAAKNPAPHSVAATGGVSIIPLTPDQVSRLTEASTSATVQQQPPPVPAVSPASSSIGRLSASTAAATAERPTVAKRRRYSSQASSCQLPEDEEADAMAAAEAADPEYRRRRDRNNVAVRKSRAKTRAREQEVDRTLGRLRGCNEDLRKKVDSVVRELKFLRSLMHKTRIPLPPELQNALRNYPTYFEQMAVDQ